MGQKIPGESDDNDGGGGGDMMVVVLLNLANTVCFCVFILEILILKEK